MTATPTASNASTTDGFDAFYRRTRTRLLVQTWALTGDRPAAVKAVRDAYVACAHHWPKVSLLDDAHADTGGSEREDWLRPIAWSRAQSRHTVPHFHRAAQTDPATAPTLAAVASLSSLHRRVLLLSHLSTANLSQLAREIGLSTRRAERELHTAITRFAAHRGVMPSEVQAAFEPLFADAVTQPWPDSTSLLRIGESRRTIHRAVGVLAVSAVCLGTGIWVTGPNHNQLSDAHWNSVVHEAAAPIGPGSLVPMKDLARMGHLSAPPIDSPTPVLSAAAVKSSGAIVLSCLGTAGDGRPSSHVTAWRSVGQNATSGWVTQGVRSSADTAAASKDYKSLLTWYDGCLHVRLQLLGSYMVKGVGDQAAIAQLVNHDGNGRTVYVGIAQTGSLTAIVGSSQPGKPITPETVAASLATLTAHLCGQQGAGTKNCVPNPVVRASAPPKLTLAPGLLSTADLPPIAGIRQSWSGTAAIPATRNLAATQCDHTSFRSAKASLTRLFLIPTAKPKLAANFAITETAGKFGSVGAADAFQDRIKAKVDDCLKNDLGSHVALIPIPDLPRGTNAFAWQVRIETDPTHSVTFDMAAISAGGAVAQVTFTPDGPHTMSDESFAALVVRAAQRLQSY